MKNYVSIIIPAYNEGERILDTLNGISNLDEIDEIIVVDDGSSDKTYDLAKSINSDKIKCFKLDKNSGKGYALNFGLKNISKEANIVGFLDADLGNTSSEVLKLVKPIINNEADVSIAKFPPPKKREV